MYAPGHPPAKPWRPSGASFRPDRMAEEPITAAWTRYRLLGPDPDGRFYGVRDHVFCHEPSLKSLRRRGDDPVTRRTTRKRQRRIDRHLCDPDFWEER